MFKLTRLKVHQFRGVEPGLELKFSPTFNVLLGKNGTGKTTLLKLLSMVFRGDFSRFEDEEFSIEYEATVANFAYRAVIKNERRERPAAEALSPGLGTPFLGIGRTAYEASCEIWLQAREPVYLRSVGSTTEIEIGGRREAKQGFRPPLHIASLVVWGLFPETVETLGGGRDKANQIFLDLWRASQADRFDESLGYFEDMLKGTLSLQIEKGIAVPVISQHVPIFEAGVFRPMAEFAPVIRITSETTSSPFLKRFVEALGFLSAEYRMDLTEKGEKDGVEIATYSTPAFSFTRRDGSLISHDHLSYGQKRLLAFLFYLDQVRQVVIADELVNGLHHSWIETCLDLLAGHQAFLTSQNPLLLDYLSFESVEQVESCFIVCDSVLRENRERMVWSNMTREAAETFFSAYQAGIEHVGEILRTRGMW